jgi:ribose transport system permease protein
MNIRKQLTHLKGINNLTTYSVFVLLILVNAVLQKGFFDPYSIKINITAFTPLILVSMAQGIIIISGNIDLSIGATIALANTLLARIMKDSPGSVIIALIVALAAVLTVSSVNGLTIGYLKLPSMVSTFAMSAIVFGIALFIMPQPGGYIPTFFYQMYQKNFLYIIPVPLVIIIAAFIFWRYLKTRKSVLYIYASGSNSMSSSASGINVPKTILTSFLISGVYIFLAGVVVTAQTATGDARMGASYMLTSVAAAVIGGISLKGGKGNMLGAAIGGCILVLAINIIFFANVPSNYQEFLRGFIIICALALAIIPSLRNEKAGDNRE